MNFDPITAAIDHLIANGEEVEEVLEVYLAADPIHLIGENDELIKADKSKLREVAIRGLLTKGHWIYQFESLDDFLMFHQRRGRSCLYKTYSDFRTDGERDAECLRKMYYGKALNSTVEDIFYRAHTDFLGKIRDYLPKEISMRRRTEFRDEGCSVNAERVMQRDLECWEFRQNISSQSKRVYVGVDMARSCFWNTETFVTAMASATAFIETLRDLGFFPELWMYFPCHDASGGRFRPKDNTFHFRRSFRCSIVPIVRSGEYITLERILSLARGATFRLFDFAWMEATENKADDELGCRGYGNAGGIIEDIIDIDLGISTDWEDEMQEIMTSLGSRIIGR